MDLLARLSRSLPLVLLVLGLVLAFLLLFLYLLVRSRRGRQEEEGMAPAPAPAGAGSEVVPVDFTGRDAALGLNASFARGLRLLKRHVSGAGYRAQIPWFLLLGEEAAQKHQLLAGANLDLPLGVPEAGQGCAWWLFDRGVVLDIASDYVLDGSGRGSDEARFQQLLRLLKRHRPERPIDGIVLALSGPDLARPGERPAERTARAERKATILAGKLRQAQTRLGLRLPVYLLVTGCERLPGFHDFFAELPERLKDEMFGWSSPYGVETAYKSEWVDEAVTVVRRDLLAAQLEVFAERRQPGTAGAAGATAAITAPGAIAAVAEVDTTDAIFTFPDEVETWKEPLGIYADRLFRSSAYHESIFPRGIYFCGADETTGRSLFLRDLFERKVFPEYTLARPTARTFGSQGRTVRLLQVGIAVGALVLGLGLSYAYRRLTTTERALADFLDKTVYSLNELKAIKVNQQKPSPKLLERDTFELFADMGEINTNRFGSVFIPSSWFTPFNHELKQAIGIAYDRIIYRGFKRGLASRVDALVAFRPAAELGGEAPLPLETNARFRELRDFVGRSVELEKQCDIYNGLKQTQRLEDMGTLVQYLYGRSLPASFYEESDLYRGALSLVQVQPFVYFEPNKEGARQVARELGSRLDRSLYAETSQIRSLGELTQAFNELGQRGSGEATESEEMTGLLNRLRKLEAEVARPDLAPLSSPVFNLGPAYEQVLGQMSTSALLGETAAREVRDEGRREHQAYRDTLASYGWEPYLQPYLVQKPTGLALSPDVKVLEQALADFLRQSSVPEGAGKGLDDRLPAGERLVWDVPLLEQAAAVYEPYRAFSEHGVNAFPGRLREPLRAVAAARVAANVNDLAVRAERFERASEATGVPFEGDLRDQVDRLNAAVKPIGNLRDVYRRLGQARNDQTLGVLVSQEGYAILRGLEHLLQQEHLYVPRQGSFAAWDGSRPLAARAFVAGDPAELPGYLDKQRERIAYLAGEYAGPVLRAVTRSDARRDQGFLRLYDRWSAIATGLKDYESKKAGNSLAGLEGLVLQDLEEVELASCAKKVSLRDVANVSTVANASGPDYFSCTASRLRRDLLRRCYDLSVDGYGRIAQLFDSRLAGRFPFSPALPGRADDEADPEAIRDFYALFDRYAPMLLAAPREGELGGGRVREWVVEMQAVRAFFAPFLDGEGKNRPPAYDIAVDFRVDRSDEQDGNQVIRWQLAAGDRRAAEKDRETDRRLRWTLGTPLEVTLGWAKDSPFVPVDAAGQELPDKAAAFDYANRWSLLALTRDHALTSGEPGESATRTLEFVLPTKNPASGAKGKTRVFLRLSFHPPQAEGAAKDKEKEKDMPQDLLLPRFPTRAPRVDAPPPLPGTLAGMREEALCVP
jgi:type VI secretion system protein ImpL